MTRYRLLLYCVPLMLCGCIISRQSVESSQSSQQLNETFSSVQQQQQQLQSQFEQLSQLQAYQTQMMQSLVTIEKKLDRSLKTVSHKKRMQRLSTQTPERITTRAEQGDEAFNDKIVLGRNEWVWFDGLSVSLKSRVDTGAMTSSLGVKDTQPFERDGQKWVRFKLDTDETEEAFEFELPLVRYVRIRQASVQGLERRPVVRLKVQVGPLVDEAEFTLSNRSRMNYPVLLGRAFLKDVAVVDVARIFTQIKHTK